MSASKKYDEPVREPSPSLDDLFPRDDDITLDDIQSLKTFLKRHAHVVTKSQLSWQRFRRHENGLEAAGAFIKKAGRVNVVVPRYKNWMLSNAPQLQRQQHQDESRPNQRQPRRRQTASKKGVPIRRKTAMQRERTHIKAST